ncbi:conjugal transfer protein [Streptomyces sp. NPDC058486]|uniref:conjugal transfer protein n=1 Tax=unclassified Streptomyces TaxID=2593676 RepID=UPI003658EAED
MSPSGSPRPRLAPCPPTAGLPRVSALPGRRAFLVRVGVWAALAAGPAALLVAFDRPAPVAVNPAVVGRPDAPVTATDEAGGPAGFAETVLGIWLESGTATGSSAELEQLRLVAPGVRAPRWGPRPVAVAQVAAVRTARREEGSWAVTVAARLTDAAQGVPREQSVRGVRFFVVPVAETRTSAGRTYAAGTPMETAGPPSGREPVSPYTARVEDEALTGTAAAFLSAFLGADGAVERYLAPGTVLTRPATRYAVVETVQVLSQGRAASVGHAGAAVRVRVLVTATDAAGRYWPMAYVLTLTARDGRWEIAAVDTGSTGPTDIPRS